MFFPPINSFFHNSVPSPVFRADADIPCRRIGRTMPSD